MIIGRLIPARLDVSAEGRALLGLPEPPALAPEKEEVDPEQLAGLMADFPGADATEDADGADHATAMASDDADDENDDDSEPPDEATPGEPDMALADADLDEGAEKGDP